MKEKLTDLKEDSSTITMGILVFLINLFYLFIFGCVGSLLLHSGFLQLRRAGATLHYGARDSHCSGVSCSLVEHRLQARGLQQLWHTGSVVVARGLQSAGSVVVAYRLSCSAACGIFPGQGLNRVPCVGRQILNHCATTREVPLGILNTPLGNKQRNTH